MTYTILDVPTRRRVDQLCHVQARPRIIATMMPNVPEAVIRAHWQAENHKSPSKGPATSRPSTYFSTMYMRLHSSLAIQAYLSAEGTGIHYVDAYIRSFEEYVSCFTAEAESFDWFFGLVRNYLDGHLTIVKCSTCVTHYLHNTEDLQNDRNCPCHRVIPFVGKKQPKKIQRTATNSRFDSVSQNNFPVSGAHHGNVLSREWN